MIPHPRGSRRPLSIRAPVDQKPPCADIAHFHGPIISAPGRPWSRHAALTCVHGARYNVISILGKRVTLVTSHSVDAMARACAFRVRSLANPNLTSSYLSALSEPIQPNVNQAYSQNCSTRADQSGDRGRNRGGRVFLQKMFSGDHLVAFDIQTLQQMRSVFFHSQSSIILAPNDLAGNFRAFRAALIPCSKVGVRSKFRIIWRNARPLSGPKRSWA